MMYVRSSMKIMTDKMNEMMDLIELISSEN